MFSHYFRISVSIGDSPHWPFGSATSAPWWRPLAVCGCLGARTSSCGSLFGDWAGVCVGRVGSADEVGQPLRAGF